MEEIIGQGIKDGLNPTFNKLKGVEKIMEERVKKSQKMAQVTSMKNLVKTAGWQLIVAGMIELVSSIAEAGEEGNEKFKKRREEAQERESKLQEIAEQREVEEELAAIKKGVKKRGSTKEEDHYKGKGDVAREKLTEKKRKLAELWEENRRQGEGLNGKNVDDEYKEGLKDLKIEEKRITDEIVSERKELYIILNRQKRGVYKGDEVKEYEEKKQRIQQGLIRKSRELKEVRGKKKEKEDFIAENDWQAERIGGVGDEDTKPSLEEIEAVSKGIEEAQRNIEELEGEIEENREKEEEAREAREKREESYALSEVKMKKIRGRKGEPGEERINAAEYEAERLNRAGNEKLAEYEVVVRLEREEGGESLSGEVDRLLAELEEVNRQAEEAEKRLLEEIKALKKVKEREKETRGQEIEERSFETRGGDGKSKRGVKNEGLEKARDLVKENKNNGDKKILQEIASLLRQGGNEEVLRELVRVCQANVATINELMNQVKRMGDETRNLQQQIKNVKK